MTSTSARLAAVVLLRILSIARSRYLASAFSDRRRYHFLSRNTGGVYVAGRLPPATSSPLPPPPVAAAASDVPDGEIPIRPPGGKWILVVEDEDDLRSAVGEFLAEVGGHYVTGVVDARSAVAVCRGLVRPVRARSGRTSFELAPNFIRRKDDLGKNSTDSPKNPKRHGDKPDCIVLDIRLGSMNGIELLKIIRSDPSLESLPVVLLTAKGRVEDRTLGYEAGADAYLAKPFERFELLSIVDGLLMPEKYALNGDSPRQLNTKTYGDLKRELADIKAILQEERGSTDPLPYDSAEEGSVDSLHRDLSEIKEMLKGDVEKRQDMRPKLIEVDNNQISLMSVLTPEEAAILNLVAQGMTNNDVATEMLCSASKIEKHITSMFKKANVSKRADLVSWWDKYLQRKERKIDGGNDKSNSAMSEDGPSDVLSAKEKAILDLLANGMATDEILSKSKLTKRQMVKLLGILLKKADVETRTELVRWWRERREEVM